MPSASAAEADASAAAERVRLQKHLLLKNLRLGWKRQRVRTLFVSILFSVLPIILLYKATDGSAALLNQLAVILPVYLVFAMFSMVQCIVVDIVCEKESKMKEVMHIYGVSDTDYWLGWLLCYGGYSAGCVLVLVSVLGYTTTIFEGSAWFLVVLAFLGQYLALIAFAFNIAVLFDRARSASVAVSVTLLLTQAISSTVTMNQKDIVAALGLGAPMGYFFNFVNCVLLPNFCFSHVMTRVTDGIPVDWSVDSFWEALDSEAEGTLAYCWLFVALLFSVVFWFRLAIFWDRRWQGEFGARKANALDWLSPQKCCRALFAGTPGNNDNVNVAAVESSRLEASLLVLDQAAAGPERTLRGPAPTTPDVPEGVACALRIRNLVKRFGAKTAVDGVSFSVKEGEIFALLGHNGAGKTTLVNCLVGLCRPDGGDAEIGGYSIMEDLQNVYGGTSTWWRRKCSICPQDNPIWPEFTVRQHLQFFGLAQKQRHVDELVEKYAKALGIQQKLDAHCVELSGGQKRRLWVATALIGTAPLCILDEPTSGMDPQSRRDLWALLKKMAQEDRRSIVFSTHYMEEADYLADRKVVLAQGSVRAIGTSADLKKRFGCGYWLNVELSPEVSTDVVGSALQSRFRKAVGEFLGISPLVSRSGRFISTDVVRDSVLIPWDRVAELGPLLDYLELHRERLQLRDFAVELTSLEEVFMKLGEDAERETETRMHGEEAGVDGTTGGSAAPAAAITNSGPPPLLLTRSFARTNQILAVYRMRIALLLNNKKGMLSQFVWPLAMQVLFLVFRLGVAGDANNPIAKIMVLVLALGPLSAQLLVSFVAQIVQDREKRVKHLAVAHGLSPMNFWLGTFLSHYLVLFLGVLCIPVFIQVTRLQPFVDAGGEPKSGPPPPLVVEDFSLRGRWGWKHSGMKFGKMSNLLGDSNTRTPMSEVVVDSHSLDLAQEKQKSEASFAASSARNSDGLSRPAATYELSDPSAAPGDHPLQHDQTMIADDASTSAGTRPPSKRKAYGRLSRFFAAPYRAAEEEVDGERHEPAFFTDVKEVEGIGNRHTLIEKDHPTRPRREKRDRSAYDRVEGVSGIQVHPAFGEFRETPGRDLFQTEPEQASDRIPLVFGCVPVTLFLLYSIAIVATAAMLLWAYTISAFFSRSETALKIVPMLLSLTNLVPLSSVTILLVIGMIPGNEGKVHIAKAIHVLGSFFLPVYAMSGTMMQIAWFAATGMHTNSSAGAWLDPANMVPVGLYGVIFQVLFYAFVLKYLEVRDYSAGASSGNSEPGSGQKLKKSCGGWLCCGLLKVMWECVCCCARCCRKRNEQETNDRDEFFAEDDQESPRTDREASQADEYDLMTTPDPNVVYDANNIDPEAAIRIERLRHRFEKRTGAGRWMSQKLYPTVERAASGTTAGAARGAEDGDEELAVDERDEERWLYAVDGISLNVKRGECFGLLGPNGAGKTTLLSLLTGELRPPVEGTALVRSTSPGLAQYDIRTDLQKIYRQMGMVPQFDALWDHLTGREHLRFYAKVCGTYYGEASEIDTAPTGQPSAHVVMEPTRTTTSASVPGAATTSGANIEQVRMLPSSSSLPPLPPRMPTAITSTAPAADNSRPPDRSYHDTPTTSIAGETLINRALEGVGLSSSDADKCVLGYSGGMKRKLSIAMTFVTGPKVLYLDEPSCGVDAMAKRLLWNRIFARSADQTVVLTTHSMEEADALCSRIGIMVNGKMRCLGSSMAIKNRYGSGYHLELLVDLSDCQGKDCSEFGFPREWLPKDDVPLTSDCSGDSTTTAEEDISTRSGGSSSTTMGLAAKAGSPTAGEPVLTSISTKNVAILVQRSLEEFILDATSNISTAPTENTGSTLKLLEYNVFSETRCRMTFSLGAGAQISRVFHWCTKNAHGIVQDYSLGQPTLEQVFLKFARQQEALNQHEGGGRGEDRVVVGGLGGAARGASSAGRRGAGGVGL